MKNFIFRVAIIVFILTGCLSLHSAEVTTLKALKNAKSNADLVIKDGYTVQIIVNNGYDLYLWDGETGIYLMYGATGNLNQQAGTVISGGTIKCYYYGTEGFECGSISSIVTAGQHEFYSPKDYEPWQIDDDNFGDYVRLSGQFDKQVNEWGYTEYIIKDENSSLVVTNDLVSGINLDDYVGKEGFFTMLYAFNSGGGQSMMPLDNTFYNTSISPVTTVDKPKFSVLSGQVKKGTKVWITQPDAAMIIYTTDGSQPSFADNLGQVYSSPVSIDRDMTIKAIAVDDEGNESAVAEAVYSVYSSGEEIEVTVWSEDFADAEYGDYVQDVNNDNATYSMQEVKNIWYTEVRNTNNAGGTAPELFMPRSTINEHFIATINLKGVDGNLNLSFRSTDDPDSPTLTITSPTEGVTISDVSNSGCKINVPSGTETLELVFGNTKTTTGGLYFDDFLLTGKTIINDNPVEVEKPLFSPDGGEVAKGTKVAITAPDAAMIIYTTDGADPSYDNAVGEVYSEPVIINENITLKAIAVDDSGNSSQIASAQFTVINDNVITLWTEDWSKAASATTDLWPSEIENDNAVYTMNKEQPIYIGTKQTNRAGGEAPELALPKQSRNEQWISTINLNGISGEMKLYYKVSKHEGLSITSTTEGVEIGDINENNCLIKVADDTDKLVLIFSNESDEYIYIDDIALTAERPEPAEFSITIGQTGYTTLYYGHYDIELPSDADIEALNYSMNDVGEFYLLGNYGKHVYAGCPVVIKGMPGTYSAVRYYVADNDPRPTILRSNVMFGTDLEEKTVGNGLFYRFEETDGNAGFYISETSPAKGKSFTNAPHTAYLCVPSVYQSDDLVIAYLLDGSVLTEIANVVTTKIDESTVYNLAGQRLTSSGLQKGIYIVNGKKVIK